MLSNKKLPLKKLLKNPLFYLVIILLIGAFLRIYRIDVLMRFIWDESRDMTAIRNIVVNKDLTFFGPFNEIDGKKDFFGVFHYYLMLPALVISQFNPVGPAIFTALLGVATVGLTYYWVSRWESKKFALAVSAILSFSPLVVRFTQWPWNPNTIGFFGILFLISLYYYRTQKKMIWIFIAGLLLGLLFQLHYFTIALGGSLIPLLFLDKKNRINFKSIVVFAVAFLLPNLTFVIFDVTHDGFYRKILLESLFGDSTQSFVSFSPMYLVLNPIKYFVDVQQKLIGIGVIGGVFALTYLKYAYDKVKVFIQSKKAVEEVQLIFSWILFLIFPILFSSLINDYHSGALWISCAIGIVYIVRKYLSEKFWIVFVFLFPLMIVANDIHREPTVIENMPRVMQISQIIVDDAQETNPEAINVTALLDADTRAVRYRYFFDVYGLDILGVDDYLHSKTLYVITPEDWETAKNNPAWELSDFRERDWVEVDTFDELYIYKIQKKF